jgi:hypothetical protein
MNERELREALRAGPEDVAARERSWRVVQAAYALREPHPRRSRRALVLVAAALVPVAVAGVAVGAPRWVREAFEPGEQRARPALVRVPGGGSLLVQSGGSTWVVSHDGAKRRLGAFSGASWSPRGLFVIAWRGRELAALEPSGAVRWSRSARARIVAARWAPGDGHRIAYLAGGALRIVNGDGTGDRRYGAAQPVTPAWRPDADHVLAYSDRRGRVNVVAVDDRRRLWRTPPIAGLTRLAWAPDGDRLAAVARGRLTVLDLRKHTVQTVMKGGVKHVAWSSRSPKFAVVRTTGGRNEVVLRRGRHARVLFSISGRLGAPVWSPDAVRLLVPWPAADQWLFLRPHGYGRPSIPVANIARQFMPGATSPAFPDAVQWCCGAP